MKEADVQRQRAQEGERTVRRQLYALEMNLAMQAFEAMHWERVGQLLRAQAPGPGQEDLRAFEWYYLAGQFGFGGQARAGARTGTLRHSDAVNRLEFATDAKTLVVFAADVSVKLWDVAAIPKLVGTYGLPEEIANQAKVEPPAALKAPLLDALVVSPDGRRAALAASSENGVQLHDFDTNYDVLCRDDYNWLSCCGPMAFAPDGQTLAAVRVVDEKAFISFVQEKAKVVVKDMIAQRANEGRPLPAGYSLPVLIHQEA